MSDNVVGDHWVNRRNVLATAALVLSLVTFFYVLTLGSTPCHASAQSTSCSVGDTETFTGPTTFQDEVTITGATSELNVGATPGPGTANQILASQGAAVPPEWVGLGSLGGTQHVEKTADETDTGGAPLQNDDHLLFSVDASSLYAVDLSLKLFPTGSDASVIFDFSVPSGTEIDCTNIYEEGGSTPDQRVDFYSEASTGSIISASHALINCVVDTDSTSGTVQFQWYGQNTGYTIQEGSWLRFAKLN